MTHLFVVFGLTAIAITSCTTSSEELVQRSPQQVMERIDMVLEGEQKIYHFKQSEEADPTEDLVNYNFYGEQSGKIDFNIHLSPQESITIQLVNVQLPNPWAHKNTSYSIYPQADMDDKPKYVKVQMVANNEGGANYVSHIGNDFPNGAALNVFTIVDYNKAANEMLCRIQNLELVHESGDENKTIRIDGTFRGSLTF
ncbi:MAG: hypothetical protein R2730_11990 [Chitinophagales bacterium]